MTKSNIIRATLLAAGLFTASLAQGVILVDQLGVLTPGDPTFNRTGSDCIAVDNGGGFFYHTYTFTAVAGQPLNVRLSGIEGTTPLDTFVAVYSPTFNPGAPLTNCVAANDDSGSLNSYVQLPAPAAGTYTVVATSFANGATGDFRVCVTQGTDELSMCLEPPRGIPTLTQWGLGGLGALLSAVAGWSIRRRRSRVA